MGHLHHRHKGTANASPAATAHHQGRRQPSGNALSSRRLGAPSGSYPLGIHQRTCLSTASWLTTTLASSTGSDDASASRRSAKAHVPEGKGKTPTAAVPARSPPPEPPDPSLHPLTSPASPAQHPAPRRRRLARCQRTPPGAAGNTMGTRRTLDGQGTQWDHNPGDSDGAGASRRSAGTSNPRGPRTGSDTASASRRSAGSRPQGDQGHGKEKPPRPRPKGSGHHGLSERSAGSGQTGIRSRRRTPRSRGTG